MTNEELRKEIDRSNLSSDAVIQIAKLMNKESADGDLISRQAVIDVILSVDNGENHIDELTTNVIGYMEQLPSAEKHAEWINKNGIKTCNNCGIGLASAYDNYCPNCGRRMKGVEEE